MSNSEPIDLVTTPPIRERGSLRDWWNRAVTVRVKALIYTAAVLIVLVTSFQIQNYQITSKQVDDVRDAQDRSCRIKIETRDTLRDILFHVVDISDVLPGNVDAEAYTLNRTVYIEGKYPPITSKDC